MRSIIFVFTFLGLFASLFFVNGCASSNTPLPTPDKVDLNRFMGAWFVQGYTPILVDKQAHNAVEHYYLNKKNQVETTYQFREGGFKGELKTYTPKGFPDKDDPSRARWKMQFVWPFKSDYVIVYVSDDYQSTIIGHPSRKYAWIMSRDHQLNENDYSALLERLKNAGYDTSVVQRLPQDWTNEMDRLKQIKKVGATGSLADR